MAELTVLGQSKIFNYTGSIQSIVLAPGTYKLEVWGASGGGWGSHYNARGGYSKGALALTEETILYIVAGGKGKDVNYNDGSGYNGGGLGHNGQASGGGATHIATITGLLKDLEDDKDSVLIVAGAGGSNGYSGSTGKGGGLTGVGDMYKNYNGITYYYDMHGTQTSGGINGVPGSFGQGGGNGLQYSGGGGGGWYGGSGSNGGNIPRYPGGGGGSGHVNETALFDANTYDAETSFLSPSGVSETGHLGNGVAKITHIASDGSDTIYTVNHYLANLNGTYTLKDTVEHYGKTDVSISPPVNEYVGFVSPVIQTVKINNDGSTVISYYYTRITYNLTVVNGISPKYQYLFGETGNLEFTVMDDASKVFNYWYSEQEIGISNIFSKKTTFVMPACDCTISVIGKPNRLNTNIYKNIFPEEVFNMNYINMVLEDLPTTSNDIKQKGHGFIVGDVVYLDSNGLYQKALAEDSERAFPIGIVSNVQSDNIFTLMKSGLMQHSLWYRYDDTSILYLSDVDPGKLLHYQMVQNKIYVPVAVYTHHGLIVNIQQGTMLEEMTPYDEHQQAFFERYTEEEIEELIAQVKEGIMS